MACDTSARVVAFLRGVYVGRKVGAEVEAATGGRITAEQFRKWEELGAKPSFAAFWTLIRVYGPQFLAALFEAPPWWLVEAAAADRAADLDRKIAAMQRDRAALFVKRPSVASRTGGSGDGA